MGVVGTQGPATTGRLAGHDGLVGLQKHVGAIEGRQMQCMAEDEANTYDDMLEHTISGKGGAERTIGGQAPPMVGMLPPAFSLALGGIASMQQVKSGICPFEVILRRMHLCAHACF